MIRRIHGLNIVGVGVDGETRCAHYRSERDIIAIKFKCCGEWFPCYECHAEFARHAAEVWPRSEFNEAVIFCGGGGHRLTVREYLDCGSVCPRCGGEFNPACAGHHHLYFQC